MNEDLIENNDHYYCKDCGMIQRIQEFKDQGVRDYRGLIMDGAKLYACLKPLRICYDCGMRVLEQ